MPEVGVDVTSCTIGIKGQIQNPTNQVDVWFDSLKSIASVLSEENQHLLKTIADKKPENITELSLLTGRAVSNLSRTIKTLEKHGLIDLESYGKSIRPRVKYNNFNILCDLSLNERENGFCGTHFTLVSMFTGVGGLDMGFEGGFKYKDKYFESQPFSTLAAYEKDEKCVETIRKNLNIPINKIELSESLVHAFPSADVLIGGFPCQDFSSCGPKRGLSSDRGQLYKVLVRYMQHHKPKIVCAENVPNLARMQKGAVLETIVNDFPDYHRDSASFSNRCGMGAVRIPALAKSVTIHSRLNR